MSEEERGGTGERRRTERAPVNAEFETLSSATFISDLSEGGVFIQTADLLPIGTVLDLNFTVLLDDPIVLSGRGRVVRHQEEPPGMGIEFLDPSPELVLRLNDVVARQRPRDLGPPIGAPDPNEDVTVHRAPMPEASDPELELQQTGLYPSIRVQIRDPEDSGHGAAPEDEDEPDTEQAGEPDDVSQPAARASEEPLDEAERARAEEKTVVVGAGLTLSAGQSSANLSLAELSMAGRTMEISAEELEEVDGDYASLSGSFSNRTLNLKATDVEIVDDDEAEADPDGDDEKR